jgi:hypothetical protein
MKLTGLVVAFFVLVGCTKPNPNVCCSNEADCNAKGIPVGSICDDGLVCRGNQCIAQPCSSGADCDPAAPYCVAELCAESCVVDAECPGFAGDTAHEFCVAGQCVSCRGTNDCGGTAPVCDANACRACKHRDECDTGVCGTDGSCIDAAQIAFVQTSGSPNTDCTQAAPCTIGRAVALTGRKYVVIASGTYTNASTVDVSGVRWFVGTGATRPRITNSGTGPVFRLQPNSDTRWENLEVFGARNTSSQRPYGSGLDAYDSGTGSRSLELVDMLLSQNEYAGLDCQACTAKIRSSIFSNNPGAGIWSFNAMFSIDRSTFTGNSTGVYLYGGLHTLTNSWFVRNSDSGVELCRSTTLTATIEFSTIADNQTVGIKSCNDSQVVFQNDLIVRNAATKSAELVSATFPGSIITTDIAAVKFKSPDIQPYDYHITAGSSAIDQAVTSTVDHDIDGQPRPMGAAADVGADELQ